MATYYWGPVFWNISPEENCEEKRCSTCGSTLKEIQKKSVVGCADCYKTFEKELLVWIKKAQTYTEHVGKIGSTAPIEVRQKKQTEQLKESLQKAIESENYEEAAVIRDQIRLFQGDQKDEKMV